MPTYTYSAATKEGQITKGTRDSESDRALARTLRAEGLLLLHAEEQEKTQSIMSRLKKALSPLRPVGLVERMFFARHLGVMISAGLSLPQTLEAIAQQTPHKKFRTIIEELRTAVVKGTTFTDALGPYENVFGELFVNMIQVGETTGKLAVVLKLLANQMKKDHDIRSRVISAMIYPAIILSAIIGIGALMLIYVVPTLSQTIRELGAELPLSTRIIIGTSEFLSQYLFWIILAGLAGGFMLWRGFKTKAGGAAFGRLILHAPIFGSLVHKYNAARFSRSLSYLVTAGVPITRSLEITARVLGNIRYREAVLYAARDIQKGKQLNEILSSSPDLFDPIVTQMIKVGEETGNLSSMLLRLALFFESEVTSTTKNLSTVIEPVLIIIIGAAVGFFAISMLQPIYSSLGNIGG
ncbi:MAG: type II secretion system F family protein [Candidatus Sungbacteria bacterium]|nr:type II secretion system F family protein [Candidatus Sungbacteria bacterium]